MEFKPIIGQSCQWLATREIGMLHAYVTLGKRKRKEKGHIGAVVVLILILYIYKIKILVWYIEIGN